MMSKAKGLVDQQEIHIFREYEKQGKTYRQITSFSGSVLDHLSVPSGERWIVSGEMHARKVTIEDGAVLILPESRTNMDDIIRVINAVEAWTIINNTEEAWMISGPQDLFNLDVTLAGQYSSEEA